jgi:Na+-transporting NADH:ubiquinone oxidoreductase subunit F
MTEFLTAVGITCLITTFLAILMVIADAIINNYGEVTLKINGSRELKAEGGRSLLLTLKDSEIFIPSACGGRGSCGLCKLKVIEGGGELLPTETPWLTAEEQKNGTRLSCQVKVRGNMSLTIPEEMLTVKQFSGTVSRMRDLTYDIKEVVIKLDNNATIDFRAGQFVQLEVPPYELTDEPVYRAYSVASAPSSTSSLELEIRYVPNGICTTYVHKHLKEGDTVTINGPYGEFHLSDTDKEIICIAGGSGMAPIKAILTDMAEKGIRRKATYFFGAKSVRDLFLVEEMKALESSLPGFRFIPALSSAEPNDKWSGEKGLITEVVARHIPDASNMEAYLCGSPFMIDACVKVLKEKGMPENCIFYDKFS